MIKENSTLLKFILLFVEDNRIVRRSFVNNKEVVLPVHEKIPGK